MTAVVLAPVSCAAARASARRCRALTNLALVRASQLPGPAREAAYQTILRTLRDHVGEPDRASAAIAGLLADPAQRGA